MRSRWRALLALTGLLAAGLVAGIAPVASASTPGLKWPSLALKSESSTGEYLLTLPDGSVKVGSGRAASIYNVGANGTLDSYVPNAAPLVYPPRVDAEASAVGRDGTVYAHASSGDGTQMIVAYKGNSNLWSYQLPCPANALRVGVDGNVYVIASGAGTVAACPSAHLIGISAKLAAGQTSPSTLFDASLGSANVLPGGLAAYDRGLVVETLSGIRFFGYDGTPGKSVSADLVRDYTLEFSADVVGRAFVILRASATDQILCHSSSVSGGIGVIAPNGSSSTFALPGCATVFTVRPTLNGGAVVHLAHPDAAGSVQVAQLLAFNPDGSKAWQFDLPETDPTDSSTTFTSAYYLVDTKGQTLVQRGFTAYDRSTGNRRPGVRLDLVNANGVSIGTYTFAGDTADNTEGGYGYQAANSNAASSPDTAYVLTQRCDFWARCQGDVSLQAVTVPGLGMDYPRGVLINTTLPPVARVYAALGDSFSGIEGVPPFEDGTDVPASAGASQYDLCHRSTRAYPRLLAADVALRLQFATTDNGDSFVACSGATTERLTTPWPDLKKDGSLGPNTREGVQKDVLDSNTQIVTVTFGGNDIGFSDFVGRCILADCSSPATREEFFGKTGKLTTLNRLLPQAYQSITDKAPNATVYVLGYPQLLPTGNCSGPGMGALNAAVKALVVAAGNAKLPLAMRAANLQRSLALQDINLTLAEATKLILNPEISFSRSEQAIAKDLVTALDRKIQAMVAQANATSGGRLVYVDPLAKGSPFIGHELCTKQPYFNGLVVNPANLAHDLSYSFHPNASGSTAYYRLVRPLLVPKN